MSNGNGNADKGFRDDDIEDALESKYIKFESNARTPVYALVGKNSEGLKRIRVIKKRPYELRHVPENEVPEDQKIEKIHFDLLLLQDIAEKGESISERDIVWYDAAKRTGRAIYGEIKDGHQLLEIKKTGSGNQTVFNVAPIYQPNMLEVVKRAEAALRRLQIQ
jgi:hypothetical protein